MEVVFVQNFGRTHLFGAVASFLKSESNVDHSWIVVERTSFPFRVSDSDLDLSFDGRDSSREVETIPPSVQVMITFALNVDRVQSLTSNTQDKFECLARKLLAHFEKKSPELVIGEFTWAVELITNAVCEHLGIEYLNIADARDKKSCVVLKGWQQSDLRKVCLKKIQPPLDQESCPALPLQNRLGWKNNINSSLVRHCLLLRGFIRIKQELKYLLLLVILFIIKKIVPRSNPADSTENSIIYYYHKTPESAVDVKGAFLSGQMCVCRNILKILPREKKLFVQFHPEARGSFCIRDLIYFIFSNRIYFGFNVLERFGLTESRTLAVTISGSIGLERGMRGLRSFTLVDTWFNYPGVVERLDFNSASAFNFSGVEPKMTQDLLDDYSQFISQQRLPGQIVSPFDYENILSAKNISDIANIIVGILVNE